MLGILDDQPRSLSVARRLVSLKAEVSRGLRRRVA
jgi:hypothetical protein